FHDILAKRGLTETQMQKALAIYERFQRDDIQVLDNERTLFDWVCKQTYIALANMMTGAAMIGIDSCPVEGFDYYAVNQLLSQTGAFDPNEYGVSVAVTFGYRAKEVKPKSRKPLTEITTWLK
ncbi:nitroreductase family protein, partial [Salmonella enterica subsp. enterica serovar Infantis]